MFQRCRIQITQEFQNSNAAWPKWITIEVLRARMVTIMGVEEVNPAAGDVLVWQYIKQQHEAIQYWGRWNAGVNSLANTAYSIGLASPENQFWTFSHVHRTINFVDVEHWTTDELSFKIPVALFNAWISNSGFDPIGAGGGTLGARGRGLGPAVETIGTGRAYVGSGNFLVPGMVEWSRQ